MSGEGPTTVGSIDAKLDIDKSKWDAKAEEVKAEAKELGSLDPTVKVDANVAGALAGLQAVTAEERKLDAARKEELITQGRASNALIDESLNRKHAAAAAKYDADQIAWNNGALKKQIEARNAAKIATEEGAQAVEKDTASVDRNTRSNQGRVRGLQVLIGLAPAILAAAAPIGAAAIGLGTAFGVMAVSGVLAVKGIKEEMAQGTQAGVAYGAGLATLKGDMDQLAQTAAVRMLGSFQDAVGGLNTAMPFLNTLIGNTSASLGEMGGTALTGVVNALEHMNPLIQEGAAQLNAFIGWLAAMPASNGFTTFVSYAVENLPSVMTLIEGLVTAAGNILAAFAPLGPVVIGFLNGLTTVINALPLPVLAGLVTAAVSLGVALRIAGSGAMSAGITAVGRALAFVGISADLAVPVVGLLLAAITGLAVGAASAAASQQQSTMAVQDYTQALRDDNNALGEHVRAQAAKALSDEGAFGAAQQLGISQSVLTGAAMGLVGPMNQVSAAVAAAKDKFNAAAQSGHAFTDSNTSSKDSAEGLMNAVGTVNKAIDLNKSSIDRGRQANMDMAAAMDQGTSAADANAAAFGTTATAYTAAVAAQDQAKASTDATTLSMQLQNDAAGLLKGVFDSLNGKSLSAADAQNAFDSSLANMGTHMDKTGKKIHFTTTSIGDMSSASVALRGQLNGQIQNLEKVVEANGGFANSTGKARAQMVTMRQQIIDNAVAHGVDRAAVTAYIDQLLHIPPTVPPTKLDVDSAAALAQLAHFQASVNQLHGKEVWLTSHVNSIYSETHTSNGRGGSGGQTRSEGGPIYRAGGGPVSPTQYLASGGYSHGPIGTDTVQAYLTPGEFVVKRASAQSIGASAMNYMNSTGKLPDTGGGGTTVHVYIDGKEMRGDMVQIAVQQSNTAIDSFARDIRNRR